MTRRMNSSSTKPSHHAPTPLKAVLFASFFVSMGTGVFWNGLSFIADERYGFSEQKNFILFAVMGVVYMVGALNAGTITRIVGRWLSPRGVLLLVVLGQASLCLIPVLFSGEWTLWCAAIGVTITASLAWPLMESYLTSGRHGQDMRSAIGWFNIIWTGAVCVPLFLMAPILENHGEWAIGGLSIINLIGAIPLWWFARQPGHHDAGLSREHLSDEYPLLLRSARVLLPLSYVLMSAMTPILPYRLDEIGVDVQWKTPATAIWMVVRFFAVIVMWRLKFWHGRWGALLMAGVTMSGGFGLIVLAPNVTTMLSG
ncbi:MAG: hypothetical protein O7G85_12135, partial [Planctomycetota bacterium]|nr:hypothetical protein [Planctomycetota bacterium]